MSKIAFVSHSYPTLQFPVQASFIKREAHLIAQSHSVEVYIPSVYALPFQQQYFRSLNPDEELIPVHRFSYFSFPGKRFTSITQRSISKNLLRSLDEQKPDIVHLHWLYPSGMAAPAIKHAGFPVVLTIHGGDWYKNLSNKRLIPRLVKCLHACDKIICVGKQLKEDIGQFIPALKKKLVHIPHGVNTEKFFPLMSGKQDPPVSGWNTNKINLLCVANLYPEKGIDILIKSFSELPDKDQYHLHIISAGGDSVTKSELNQMINKLSLSNHVTFYNSQPHERLADFYRSADILISPSRKEGFGLVVAEAIACGTPVLATKSGGPEEIVTDQTGKIVQIEDPKALTADIRELVSSPSRFSPKNLHNYIKTHFSLALKSNALTNLYQDLAKPHHIQPE